MEFVESLIAEVLSEITNEEKRFIVELLNKILSDVSERVGVNYMAMETAVYLEETNFIEMDDFDEESVDGLSESVVDPFNSSGDTLDLGLPVYRNTFLKERTSVNVKLEPRIEFSTSKNSFLENTNIKAEPITFQDQIKKKLSSLVISCDFQPCSGRFHSKRNYEDHIKMNHSNWDKAYSSKFVKKHTNPSRNSMNSQPSTGITIKAVGSESGRNGAKLNCLGCGKRMKHLRKSLGQHLRLSDKCKEAYGSDYKTKAQVQMTNLSLLRQRSQNILNQPNLKRSQPVKKEPQPDNQEIIQSITIPKTTIIRFNPSKKVKLEPETKKNTQYTFYGTELGKAIKITPIDGKNPVLSKSSLKPVQVKFRCPVCKMIFDDKSALLEHNSVHIKSGTQNGSEIFPCRSIDCTKVLKSKMELLQHQKSEHLYKNEIKSDTLRRIKKDKDLLVCDFQPCDGTFADKKQYKEHLKANHYIKCSLCPITFENQKKLDAHKDLKHKVHCPKCPAVCSSKEEMLDHRRMKHTMRCNICLMRDKTTSAEYASKLELWRHERSSHSFKCPVGAQCANLNFVYRDKLEEHTAKAHRFRCPECARAFSGAEELSAHSSEHQQCSVCEDEFSWPEPDHRCYYTRNKVRPQVRR